MKTILARALLGLWCLGSLPASAGPAETQIFQRLALKEQSFFGTDADVRRLLDDSYFEADLRRWFLAVNPAYVENALRGGYPDEPNPEAAEMRGWAAKSGLKANNDAHLRMRQMIAAYVEAGLPSEKGEIYLAYFLRTGQVAKAKALLRIYAIDYALFAGEFAEDPRHRGTREAAAMYSIANQVLSGNRVEDYASCAGRYTGNVDSLREVGTCLQGQITFKLPAGYAGPTHVVSRTGFVDGNDVAYFTDNRHDHQIIGQFEELYRGDRNPVADLLGKESSADFSSAFLRNSSPLSGLPLVGASHPALAPGPALDPKAAIFAELVRGMRSAKHTIFVDIFFLGGTLGATLADELIAAAERGVHVFLLHDPYNTFEYRDEIEPVFKTVVAYSLLHPDRVTAAGSYIMAHRTGLPRFMDTLLPDSVVENVLKAAREVLHFAPPLFPKAKSDHSKVMVLDGAGLWADSTPVAYVGSKNWTDSSGAMTFDEVARVTGPAAVAVQDNYYWDMWFALRSGSGGRPVMQSAAIEKALESFDALGRRWDPASGHVQITRTGLINAGAVASGGVTVRVGENNVDGSIMSALDQNIYAIRMARKQIIINDQFLYDRRIVEELLDKARSNPQLQIYILLEPISKTSGLQTETLGGFPNNLYLDQLTYQSLELDKNGNPQPGKPWPNIHFRWKRIPDSSEFHLEYHMKTISVDGFDAQGRRVTDGPAMIISGSANKDCMTMTGAFRESQVEIWDSRDCSSGPRCGAVAEADRIFWKRWSNLTSPDEGFGSENADPFRFSLPAQVQSMAKQALGREMTAAEFTLFMRSLIHAAYDLERSSTVE